jgi:hypothetical protein
MKSNASKQATQSSKRSRKRFEKGTSSISTGNQKEIEVEKDEMIFRKMNGSWKLIADYKKGLTHEQGGEDTVVQEGDVIFPGNKRTKIMGLLAANGVVQKEDLPTFESERSKLPSDSVDGTAEAGFDYAGTAAQLAPVISNLIEGFGGKAEKSTRRKVKSKKLRFVDTSQEQLNEADIAFKLDQANITKKAGGNAGVLLANVGAASSRRSRTKASIKADRAQKLQQVQNLNTQNENTDNRINTQLDVQFDIQDAQNEAAKRAFQREVVSGASEVGQQAAKNKGLSQRDQKLIELENKKLNILKAAYPNFEFDEEGNIAFKREDQEVGKKLERKDGGAFDYKKPTLRKIPSSKDKEKSNVDDFSIFDYNNIDI